MEPTPTAVLSAQEKASPSDTGLFGCDMLEKSVRQGPWSLAVDKSKSQFVPSAMPRDPDPGVMVPHRRIRPLFLCPSPSSGHCLGPEGAWFCCWDTWSWQRAGFRTICLDAQL